MIIPMSKIEIIGHKGYLYPTLEELQKWGKLHIDNIPVVSFIRGSFLRRIYFDEAQCKERDIRETVEKALDEIVRQIPREIYYELNEKLEYERKELPYKTTHVEHPTVVLRNPKVLRPFERLVGLYALPMYGTIDPTPSLSFFFPIFFGAVLGDVGYGILLTGFAGIMYVLAGERQYLKDFSLIAFTFSVCSIIFGFLYGELFGIRMGLKPLLPQLARGHADGAGVVLNCLILAVSFGVLHVLYGIVLGIVVSFRRMDVAKALEGIARIMILFGVTFIVCKLINVLPSVFFLIGISCLIISIPFLIYAGWILAVLEISTLIGHILSYCRLMALGMGSVYIVFVGDELDFLIENEVLGKVVLVIVHAFNLVVHIAIPTVHALRLHYVEFFTKFFVSGGKPYMPLRKTEITLRG